MGALLRLRWSCRRTNGFERMRSSFQHYAWLASGELMRSAGIWVATGPHAVLLNCGPGTGSKTAASPGSLLDSDPRPSPDLQNQWLGGGPWSLSQ